MNEKLARLLMPNGIEITLPSKGKFGGPATVSVRGFIAKDEKDLLQIDIDYPIKQLRSIAENLVTIPENFSLNNCIENDIIAILMTARYLTYGETVSCDITCNHCGQTSAVDKSLVTDLEYSNFNLDSNRSEIELPKSKVKVLYHVLTIGEQKTVEAQMTQTKNLFKQDNLAVQAYLAAAMIDKLIDRNGNEISLDIFEKRQFVSYMSKVDAEAWAEDKAKFNCGYSLIFDHTCSNCNGQSSYALGIGYDFFYSPIRAISCINMMQ